MLEINKEWPKKKEELCHPIETKIKEICQSALKDEE